MANFTNILKINTRVEVSLDTSPNDYYDSRIQHVSRDAIGIILPSKRGRPITIAKGAKVNVSVLTEEARYGFQTTVTGIITDQIRLVKLAMPQRIEQLQMRQFFRVPAYIRIHFHFGPLEKLSDGEDRG